MGDATTLEQDEDVVSGPATLRTTSRKRGGKRVVTTRQEFVDPDEDEDRVQLPGLFALSDIEEQSIVRVRVYRKDPDEGMVGYLEDPNTSEDEVKDRWGGSQFRLEGLNNIGKICAVRTVRIAGDPLFVSPTFRMEWEKRRGINSSQAPVQQGMGVQEMMALMREQEVERRKGEDDRRRIEADERRQHEEKMRRIEIEADERRRKDERDREDRKAREDKDREEARRRDEQEREERRRKDADAAEQRQRAHTEQMLAMVRASSEQALQLVKVQATQTPQNSMMDAVKLIGVIKEAFGDNAPQSEESDPLNLIIKHGADWLKGIGDAASGVVREVKGNAMQSVVQQPVTQQLPAASQEGLTIPASSPLAGKLQNLVGTIAARGRNPEEVLAQVMDNLQATLDGKPPVHVAAPVPPAAPAPPPAAVVQPAAPVTEAAAAPVTTPPSPITVVKTVRGSHRLSFS